jgi:hypothetical protein
MMRLLLLIDDDAYYAFMMTCIHICPLKKVFSFTLLPLLEVMYCCLLLFIVDIRSVVV